MKNTKTIIILLFVVLFLDACSLFPGKTNQPAINKNQNNGGAQEENPTAENAAVEIKNLSFIPAVLTVKMGTTVVWTNNDSTPHDIKSDLFASPKLAKGESFNFKFEKAGEYDYICGLHPSMKGKIVVE